MSVSSIAAFGSAAIATPTSDANSVKREETPAETPPGQHVEAAKAPGTGQVVDRTV
jgi:hypothetical protein